ncbi:TIR domain-containing protein [Pseudomonas aeruginosa]|uniref:TIR domain-containing protein n=1 Tax=Pseudomonas aeruginosa TaxID=287 RepID=UPI001FF90533|nr:TIR domain-containing protein [Pseudomonas aeruginosa]UPG11204.1 TIR domain-containing protein [Pseudomonas aeruginosa]
MARKVFFSFQYEDVHRAMNVRNSGVIASDTKVGFIDKAEFEECSGLLIPDTDLGENPRRERGV